jgi:hypothetical protein
MRADGVEVGGALEPSSMVDVVSAYFSERMLLIGADGTIVVGSASADPKAATDSDGRSLRTRGQLRQLDR